MSLHLTTGQHQKMQLIEQVQTHVQEVFKGPIDACPWGARILKGAQTEEAWCDAYRHLRQLADAADGAHFFEVFTQAFLKNVAPEDLEAVPLMDWVHSIVEFLLDAAHRPAGVPKIRILQDGRSDGDRGTILHLINDNMPFLVDSTVAELNRRGLSIYLLIHPVLHVGRNADGWIDTLKTWRAGTEQNHLESCICVELSARLEDGELEALQQALEQIFSDVRHAVQDWAPMRTHMLLARENLELYASGKDKLEVLEFLNWLYGNHFTFLGYRNCRVDLERHRADIINGSGLGILRDAELRVLTSTESATLSAEERFELFNFPGLLSITKSTEFSTVHRAVPMDMIRIKRFDEAGEQVGEDQFLGLFTSTVYHSSVGVIPLIRMKVQRVLEKSGISPDWHDGKALLHILETFPRDELLQMSTQALLETSTSVLRLQERQRVAVFLREDPLGHTVTCLVYIPRDRYEQTLRDKIGTIVATAVQGRVISSDAEVGDLAFARLNYLISKPIFKSKSRVAYGAVEEEIMAACLSWGERLKRLMMGHFKGLSLKKRTILESYIQFFPKEYQDHFTPFDALEDLPAIQRVLEEDGVVTRLIPTARLDGGVALNLRIFQKDTPLVLSDIIPILDQMGCRIISENPYALKGDSTSIWFHNFEGFISAPLPADASEITKTFEDTLRAIFRGESAVDGLSALVFLENLPHRHVAILRAYAKYMRQIEAPFSQNYIEKVVVQNHALAAALIRLFLLKFDPQNRPENDAVIKAVRDDISEKFDALKSLDEDRILKLFLELIDATLRVNFYLKGANGTPEQSLVFKFRTDAISALPLPKPMFEIFIYSPEFEAVHLRGGKIARGGIRWSDRLDDFRTEILGLLKAQMVKNAVIVPTGSKGGFVIKKDVSRLSREDRMAEGVRCYQRMMKSLLSITDNIVNGAPQHPENVLCYDEADPYLVVAADKGTATFSDIANTIAVDDHFWLGDAFASGGSAGYDHKKMGITARGAWVAVSRHFRERGIDIQTTPFRVIGVGDMSGDVFGNAMLLSDKICLNGAFNHTHIFVDPTPDPLKSYAERARLFALPRSSWSDYDPGILSPGGRVYERTSKSLILTPEVQNLLGVTVHAMTPPELIRALLTLKTDLLWFGGIGTYVKASYEPTSAVGDAANDGIRVNGKDLRCTIIGEGANLAVTQLGRIEFAQRGGAINTDAIDNSAGVDCSDHEVNIKILTAQLIQKGLLTLEDRNILLEAMTDNVAELVLQDNDLQTQILSISEAEAPRCLEAQGNLMRLLEAHHNLNRAVEFLPDDTALEERRAAGVGLTRPELAVLLAYSKNYFWTLLREDPILKDPYFEPTLKDYFPDLLKEKFGGEIRAHPLAEELLTTILTNTLINRMGITAPYTLQESLSCTSGQVIWAYIIAGEILGAPALLAAIEALNNHIPAAIQIQMFQKMQLFMGHLMRWLLREETEEKPIGEVVTFYAPHIQSFLDQLQETAGDQRLEALTAKANLLKESGVPPMLAEALAALSLKVQGVDLVRMHHQTQAPLDMIAEIYFGLGAMLHLGRLRATLDRNVPRNDIETEAVRAIILEIQAIQVQLTRRVLDGFVLENGARPDVAAALDDWRERHHTLIDRILRNIEELGDLQTMDLARITVILSALRTAV